MKTLLLFLFLFCLPGLGAQDNPVTNVTVRVSEEQDMVTITYNLARNSRIPFYTIAVNLSLDGIPLPNPVGLTGDLGSQVTAGLGKRIVWNALQDVTSLAGELKIDVVSNTSVSADGPTSCVPIKTLPVYAGIGGIAVTGLGLLVSGLSQQGEANTLYEVYSDNRNPTAAVYTSLSRDAHYEEANSKHKQGTWLSVGGGLTLAAGGASMVMRLLKINAYNRQCAAGEPTTYTLPRLQLNPAFPGAPGLALTYSF